MTSCVFLKFFYLKSQSQPGLTLTFKAKNSRKHAQWQEAYEIIQSIAGNCSITASRALYHFERPAGGIEVLL